LNRLPLIFFIALVIFMASGLKRDPRDIPSPLIGRPAPAFSLPPLDASAEKTFSPDQMRGTVWLLNVWASWCPSCRAEHSLLLEIKNRLPLVGLNYKEVRGDVEAGREKISPGDEIKLARERGSTWLKRHGNPYAITLLDIDGRVGLDYGVYGVPETFVIDKNGVIRFRHTGPMTRETLNGKIMPLVEKLSKARN
jgi:cytochrome c biogenesis protein CcmG/thiol:disulfide interchange protein DsbE